MNAPEKIAFLPDIQSQVDHRALRIDAVGIKGVRHPITIRTGAGGVPTVATFSIAAYTVEVENFESIHNHSALARIARPANMTEGHACRR